MSREIRRPGTDLVRRESHGHQPQLALKIGDVEMDPCGAIGVEPDDAGAGL